MLKRDLLTWDIEPFLYPRQGNARHIPTTLEE
ncbi:unnamed protein product [Larinioides sclopetarius]|uniref:Uncharacterized protein n=1 Tax=Larinioides sclopetarius TaxID=280406 RepID=A0AAV1ZKY9_9ARAC